MLKTRLKKLKIGFVMRFSTQIQQFVEKSANITTAPEAVCTAVSTACCKNGSFSRITHCIFSTGMQRRFLNNIPLRSTRLSEIMLYSVLLKYSVHQMPKAAAHKINIGKSQGKIAAPAAGGSKPISSTRQYAALLFSILSPTFHNRTRTMIA